MKKSILGILAVSTILFLAFAFEAETFKVDTKLSSMGWKGTNLTMENTGVINLSDGYLSLKGNEIIGGRFEIDMTSIRDTNFKDESWSKKLDDHLKSEDFFEVQTHPKAIFNITSVTPIKEAKSGGFTHKVQGNLTLKGVTNEMSFDATIKQKDNKVACVGTAVVDRSKHNVKYASKTFFANIGDKMIHDEFTVKFNVVASK